MATDNELETIIRGLKRHTGIDLSHSDRGSFMRDLGIALAQHDAAMDEEGDDAASDAENVLDAAADPDDQRAKEAAARAVEDAGLAQYSLESRPIIDEARHAREFVDNQIRRGVIGLRKRK